VPAASVVEEVAQRPSRDAVTRGWDLPAAVGEPRQPDNRVSDPRPGCQAECLHIRRGGRLTARARVKSRLVIGSPREVWLRFGGSRDAARWL